MSVDLKSTAGEEFSFSTIGWAFYLNLARIHYGWNEAGTQPPKEWSGSEGPWQGVYDLNAGQFVTTDDALAFANALEEYLNDPSRMSKAKALAVQFSKALGTDVSADENDHQYVESFVQFAQKGGFSIW